MREIKIIDRETEYIGGCDHFNDGMFVGGYTGYSIKKFGNSWVLLNGADIISAYDYFFEAKEALFQKTKDIYPDYEGVV